MYLGETSRKVETDFLVALFILPFVYLDEQVLSLRLTILCRGLFICRGVRFLHPLKPCDEYLVADRCVPAQWQGTFLIFAVEYIPSSCYHVLVVIVGYKGLLWQGLKKDSDDLLVGSYGGTHWTRTYSNVSLTNVFNSIIVVVLHGGVLEVLRSISNITPDFN